MRPPKRPGDGRGSGNCAVAPHARSGATDGRPSRGPGSERGQLRNRTRETGRWQGEFWRVVGGVGGRRVTDFCAENGARFFLALLHRVCFCCCFLRLLPLPLPRRLRAKAEAECSRRINSAKEARRGEKRRPANGTAAAWMAVPTQTALVQPLRLLDHGQFHRRSNHFGQVTMPDRCRRPACPGPRPDLRRPP
jgi:hypothetical protein